MEITSEKIQSKIIELSQNISDFYMENNDFKYLSINNPLMPKILYKNLLISVINLPR